MIRKLVEDETGGMQGKEGEEDRREKPVKKEKRNIWEDETKCIVNVRTHAPPPHTHILPNTAMSKRILSHLSPFASRIHKGLSVPDVIHAA